MTYEAAKKCLLRNRTEIEEDGAKKYTVKDTGVWKGQNVPSKNYRGRVEYDLGDGVTLSIPNGGIYLFSKRAVLRFGMLLQGSEVAREVRTQLLNIFDQATEEQRLKVVFPAWFWRNRMQGRRIRFWRKMVAKSPWPTMRTRVDGVAS